MALFRREQSFEDRVARAEQRQELLRSIGSVSLETDHDDGRLVIVVSGYPDHNSPYTKREQTAYLRDKAEELREERYEQHKGGVEIRRGATKSKLVEDLRDETVTDMVVIANGRAGSVFTHRGVGAVDMFDLAEAATHLKQGRVEQYMYGFGELAHEKSTEFALGRFVVADAANAIVQTGLVIPEPQPVLAETFIPLGYRGHVST